MDLPDHRRMRIGKIRADCRVQPLRIGSEPCYENVQELQFAFRRQRGVTIEYPPRKSNT